MRRVLVLSLALAVTTTGVVGCSSGTGGTAVPTTDTPTTSVPSRSSTPSSAPKVADPLDASKFVAAPCLSLTTSNVVSIDVTNPISGADTDANGSGCTWSGESGGGLSVSWVTANTNGLSDLYVKQSTYAYWQPTTIAGYPAVYGDALSDGRSQGDCVLNVGVSDHLAFFVQYTNSTKAPESCTLASQAASDVIANVKGGA